jgi:hypothetical protein
MNTPQVDTTAETPVAEKMSTAKLAYAAPELVVLGSAAEMTRNSTSTVADGTVLTGS